MEVSLTLLLVGTDSPRSTCSRRALTLPSLSPILARFLLTVVEALVVSHVSVETKSEGALLLLDEGQRNLEVDLEQPPLLVLPLTLD